MVYDSFADFSRVLHTATSFWQTSSKLWKNWKPCQKFCGFLENDRFYRESAYLGKFYANFMQILAERPLWTVESAYRCFWFDTQSVDVCVCSRVFVVARLCLCAVAGLCDLGWNTGRTFKPHPSLATLLYCTARYFLANKYIWMYCTVPIVQSRHHPYD